MPAVAVVLPVRDRAGMLSEAIASVLAQTYRDFALVVVDDGSTDDSGEVAAAAILAAPAGSRVLRQDPRGVAAARNAGVATVDSAWIALLDSDDLWLPQKLAVQLAWLASRPSYRIAQTGERWLDGGRHRNPRVRHRKGEHLFPRCLERCLVSPSAVVVARGLYEALGGFDESFEVCEDYELWLRIALREPVGLVPAELVVKRGGHPGQLSRSTWGLDRFRVAALAKYLVTTPLTDAQRAAVVTMLRAKCEVLAGGAERRGRGEEAARYRALADAAAAAALDVAAVAAVGSRCAS